MRLAILSVCLCACGSSGGSGGPDAGTAVVEVRWFCCLGTGDAPEQVEVEDQVVADFNASHPGIRLIFEHVPYDQARDTLAIQIASGDPPDIVGPAGIGGASAFPDEWLDLTSLIADAHYDLSGFPAEAVAIYALPDEGQVGIPFAVYPSALFYKKSHFAAAGLNEPPHRYGDPYVMPDGSQVAWTYDTLHQVAQLLTLDSAGLDATQSGFDPGQIVQWGFEPQRDDLRGLGAYWGAGSLVAGDGMTAQIPAAWAAAWRWWYAAMWVDHFVMTGPVHQDPDINPNEYPFFTGQVSMSQNFLWSTYGVADAGDDWDLAALPSYDGRATASINADTFRILKDSRHPAEAFQAMAYLLDEAAPVLLPAYGGMPARTSEQDAFFAALSEQFAQTIDWQVAVDGIARADQPNFEGPLPAYNQVLDILAARSQRWQAEPGLDMDQEIADLLAELQAAFDGG